MSIGLAPPPTVNDINPADFLIAVASIGAPPSAEDVYPSEILVAVQKSRDTAASGGIEGFNIDEDVETDLGVGIVGEDVSASTFPIDESGVLNDSSVRRGRGWHPPGSAVELQSAFAESEEGLKMAEEAFGEAERAKWADDGAGSRGWRGQDMRSTFWLSMVLTHREVRFYFCLFCPFCFSFSREC